MLRRPRTWYGLLLCLIGIVLARGAAPAVTPLYIANSVYLIGIVAALAGIVLVASAMQVASVSAVTCPQCFLVSAAEVAVCSRCNTSLNKIYPDALK